MKFSLKSMLLICFVLFSFKDSMAGDDPAQILGEMGFAVVNEQSIPFELTDLNGQNKKLEDFKGKWVWLVFWATWCGPCVSEMPSLESLHQEYKQKGLSLIGVSIDQSSPSTIKRFVAERGVTFPILHDSTGEVANKYQASAVPSIYVISPDGRLAGVFRGANNWERQDYVPLIERLLKIKAYKGATATQGGSLAPTANSSLPLPNKLVPPEMSWVVTEKGKNPELGKALDYEIRIKWKGEPKEYLLNPPQVTLPENVTMGTVSSYSQSTPEGSELIYRIPLTFLREGTYSIGPVELSYRSRVGGPEQFSRMKERDFTVKESFVAKYLALVFGVLAFLAGTGYLIEKKFLRSKRNLQKRGIEEEAARKRLREELKDRYSNVQKLKVRGAAQDYALELLKFFKELLESAERGQAAFPLEDKNLQEKSVQKMKIQKLLEEIQFGGKSLSSEDTVYWERTLEKIIAHFEEAP